MRMPLRLLKFLMLASLITGSLSAQAYEGHGRDPAEFNKGLSGLKIGSIIPLLDDAGTGSFNNWCTSFLAAEGSKPVKTADMDAELHDYQRAVDEWSCMYSPQRAQDRNPATAWCEAAADAGVGEVMIARVDVSQPVRIWAGFGQSNDYYQKNARPKKVLVSILIAESTSATQDGTVYQQIKVRAQTELELKDFNGYQALKLPALKLGEHEEFMSFVAIKILSVYPGSKYQDTLISELGNYD